MIRKWLYLTVWLLAMAPAHSFAQFTYLATNGAVTVTGYSGTNPAVKIPATITVGGVELPVVAVGDYAFQGLAVASVEFPNSLTNIGYAAFLGCQLDAVIIPGNVIEIGDSAFANCPKLTTTSILDGVRVVGWDAFAYCPSLTNVSISVTVTNIQTFAFLGTTLSSLSVDPLNPAFSADGTALFNRDQTVLLAYVGLGGAYAVPDTVKAIADNAFNDAPVTDLFIPDSVTNIGLGAFEFAKLQNVSLEGHLVDIGNFAFEGCDQLTNVFLGGLTRLGDRMFGFCRALTHLELPATISSVGTDPFSFCGSLTNIEVDPQNSNFASVDGVMFNHDRSLLVAYPGGRTGPYAVPTGVTAIGPYAFAGGDQTPGAGLSAVTLPDSLSNRFRGTVAQID